MKKKPTSGPRRVVANPEPQSLGPNWLDIPEGDICFYTHAFRKAAQALAQTVSSDSMAFGELSACPVVFMYRYAIELHLKALVLGEGANFLATRPDALSIHKTHSLSWLAQFVCQIVTAVRWEKEFNCEGIENLADFKVIIDELSSVDPSSNAFRYRVWTEGQASVPGRLRFSVREFSSRMDALLNLLNSTADALAAEWDLRSDAAALKAAIRGEGDFGPTVQ